MMKRIKRVKSEEGYALVMVILVFAILSILTFSVIYLNDTNMRQTKSQIEDKQAYYLAHSGIEIGYAALMQGSSPLIEAFKATGDYSKESSINYGENNQDLIEISIKSSTNKKRITITSKATHKKSGIIKTVKMSFPVDYPSMRKWE